jgi:hypothetical protein
MTQMPEAVKALTGLDINQALTKLNKLGDKKEPEAKPAEGKK